MIVGGFRKRDQKSGHLIADQFSQGSRSRSANGARGSGIRDRHVGLEWGDMSWNFQILVGLAHGIIPAFSCEVDRLYFSGKLGQSGGDLFIEKLRPLRAAEDEEGEAIWVESILFSRPVWIPFFSVRNPGKKGDQSPFGMKKLDGYRFGKRGEKAIHFAEEAIGFVED